MRRPPAVRGFAAAIVVMVSLNPAVLHAQSAGDWDAGVNAPSTDDSGSSPFGNVTVMPRTSDGAEETEPAPVPVRLIAFLTVDGQRIDKDLVWRVYRSNSETETSLDLLTTDRNASPNVKLAPGDYIVNAAFGRANITRPIHVEPSTEPVVEKFVLNAGGLRVNVTVSGHKTSANAITYNIYSDRDQTDNRKLVMASAKPGLIIRLNAGIYHIVSSYGDANAIVASDVTVEAGKLTEATVAHAAAKVTFKLVAHSGGEALPGTKWTIQTTEGRNVKTSVGALPTHVLAPGSYIAIAKSQGKVFSREFTINDGETTQIEVLVR